MIFGRCPTPNPSQGILNEVISDTCEGFMEENIEEIRSNASKLKQKQSEISTKRYSSNKKRGKAV